MERPVVRSGWQVSPYFLLYVSGMIMSAMGGKLTLAGPEVRQIL